jgi:hypothetical protein
LPDIADKRVYHFLPEGFSAGLHGPKNHMKKQAVGKYLVYLQSGIQPGFGGDTPSGNRPLPGVKRH